MVKPHNTKAISRSRATDLFPRHPMTSIRSLIRARKKLRNGMLNGRKNLFMGFHSNMDIHWNRLKDMFNENKMIGHRKKLTLPVENCSLNLMDRVLKIGDLFLLK